MERPDIVEDDMLCYLDCLRGSGETNMFGAGMYLTWEFDLSRRDAHAVLSYWMATFETRRLRGELCDGYI